MAALKPHRENRPRGHCGLIFANAWFELPALLALASQLRDGLPCTADVDERPKGGSLNWAVFLTFTDGVEWVFRAPRSHDSMVSDESAAKMLASEVATMRYLKNNTTVPVPEVFSFSATVDNAMGVPYILMSKAAGRSLGDYDWVGMPARMENCPVAEWPLRLPMTDKAREKVMFQLGKVLSGLVEHRFDKIGSLEDGQGDGDGDDPKTSTPSIGESLGPAFVWYWRGLLKDIARGPFADEHQYLMAQTSALVGHGRELSLSRHAVLAPMPHMLEYPRWASYSRALGCWKAFTDLGDRFGRNSNCVDYYILGHLVERMVLHVLGETTETTKKKGGGDRDTGEDGKDGKDGFVLVHPDLHPGNIFVDDDFNITCIIDWASASTGSLEELLAAPQFGNVCLPWKASLVAAYRDGFRWGQQGGHGEQGDQGEQGEQGDHGGGAGSYTFSPAQWHKANMLRPFLRLARLHSEQDYLHLQRLYALVDSKDGKDDGNDNSGHIPGVFRKHREMAYAKEELERLDKERGKKDGKEETKQQEVTAKRKQTAEELQASVIARKLTVMEAINGDFVADRRLWQWVDDALDEEKETKMETEMETEMEAETEAKKE